MEIESIIYHPVYGKTVKNINVSWSRLINRIFYKRAIADNTGCKRNKSYLAKPSGTTIEKENTTKSMITRITRSTLSRLCDTLEASYSLSYRYSFMPVIVKRQWKR